MEKENYYNEIKNLPFGIRILQFYFIYIGKYFPKLSGMVFWKVFCKPKKRTIRKKHKQFLETSNIDIVKFQGENIRTYSWGKGEKKILIVHGWEGMSADFNELINKLVESGYSIMAIDLPAHGNSTGKRTNIPIIMELVKRIIKEKGPFYGIVSHSLGAASTAFLLADLNGTFNISKLVLMGLHPLPLIFFEQFRQVLKIKDDLYRKCLNYVENEIGKGISDFSVPKIIPLISANKTLLIHDEKDEVVNIKDIKHLNNEWKDAELFTGDHGGHFKHFKHQAVVNKIVQFVELS